MQTIAYSSMVKKLTFLFTDVVSEITSSGQPQLDDKKQSEAVIDPTETDRNKFTGQQIN